MYLLPLRFAPKLTDHQVTSEVVCLFYKYVSLGRASALTPSRFWLNDSSSDHWMRSSFSWLSLLGRTVLV